MPIPAESPRTRKRCGIRPNQSLRIHSGKHPSQKPDPGGWQATRLPVVAAHCGHTCAVKIRIYQAFEGLQLIGKSVTTSPQFPATVRRSPTERARVTHGPRACVVCSGSQAASDLHCPEKLHLHLLLDCPPCWTHYGCAEQNAPTL